MNNILLRKIFAFFYTVFYLLGFAWMYDDIKVNQFGWSFVFSLILTLVAGNWMREELGKIAVMQYIEKEGK